MTGEQRFKIRRFFKRLVRGAFYFVCGVAVLTAQAFFIYVETPSRITLDLGGSLVEYIQDYTLQRHLHRDYVIDGACISACTLITGEIPPERVCITPYARLAFHAAFVVVEGQRVFAAEGTKLSWQIYPPAVRAMLQAKGWKDPDTDQPTLIWLDHDDLLKIYKPCT